MPRKFQCDQCGAWNSKTAWEVEQGGNKFWHVICKNCQHEWVE